MSGISRYPLSVDTAAPGKLVRTRSRPAQGGSSASSTPVAYLGRTLLPLASSFQQQSSYTIKAGDRLDNLSATLLGNPLLYWMLLEANNISDPAMLCAVPGRVIIVPAAVGQGSSPLDEPIQARRSNAAAPAAHSDDSEEAP